jgi:hypothetical protein
MVNTAFWPFVTVGVNTVVSNGIVALNRCIIIVLPCLVFKPYSINLNPIHVQIIDLSTTPFIRMTSNDLGVNIGNVFRTGFRKKRFRMYFFSSAML